MAETVNGVDYSAGRPGGRALKAAGKQFVMKYLSTTGNPKNLTRAEADDLAAHDVWVGVVFETTAGRAGEGRAAGIHDAQSAMAQAAVCGKPGGRPIYFAVDYDADPVAVVPYFQGVASVLGVARTGAYGGFRVIKYLLDHKLITFAWQTAAWSANRWDARAHIRQSIGTQTINGVACDRDTAYFPDYGQWKPGVAPNQSQEKEVDWHDKITIPGEGNPYNSKDQTAEAGQWLGYGNQKAGAALEEVQALRKEVAQLQTTLNTLVLAVGKIGAATGADPAKLADAILDAESKRLEG